MSYRYYRPKSYSLKGCGCGSPLGDVLTDFACDAAANTRTWQQRLAAGLSTGAQAAVVGGIAAGLLGGLVSRGSTSLLRPLLGAAAGAAVSWGAYAIWTGPLNG